MSKCYIFTLNWNGVDKLKKLYPTLIRSFNNIDYAWFIKDNGSSDESINEIQNWNNNKINLIKCPHNKDNFSQGCNILFKEASPKDDDFILLLNNDIIINDNKSIENMINIIKNDNEVGAVGARLLYTNTNKIQHAGVIFNKQFKTPYHFRAHIESDHNAEKNREFQAVTGAVWLTKKQYYENICTINKSKLDGLDECFFWCFEDVSANLSIKYNMKKKIIYCGQTNIFHEESASLKKNPVNRLFLAQNINYFRNMWVDKIILDEDLYKNDINYNLYNKIKK